MWKIGFFGMYDFINFCEHYFEMFIYNAFPLSDAPESANLSGATFADVVHPIGFLTLFSAVVSFSAISANNVRLFATNEARFNGL